MRGAYAAAAVIFVVLSVAMTWPLALNMDRAMADPGDAYIVTWILDWNWWATFHQPLSLFDANIFHPSRYSLAFSEHLYGLAVFLFPLRAAGVGPITAYNLAILASFAFCGFAAFLLGRHLTGSWLAGMAAGVFYAFVPFRFVHISHLQHVSGGWLPLLLLALLLYAESPSRRRAVLFGAVFAINGLTNVHYFLFGSLAVAITALLLIPRRQWRDLMLAAAGALVLLAPFLYPYSAAASLYGMQRTWEEVYRFSALPIDWIRASDEPERRLFPGTLPLLVALAGALVAGPLARRAGWQGDLRRARASLSLSALWIGLGFLGSLGLHFEFHRFLFGAVPAFRAIRVPARWAVIAYIGIAILIALATAVAARRSRWAGAAIAAALLVTLWAAPVRWFLVDPVTPPVYRWLAEQPEIVIAELPMGPGGLEYEYMLMSTIHRKRMVNGISGFAPPSYETLMRQWTETPIPDSFLAGLKNAGVDLVIVHADGLGEQTEGVREWIRREVSRGRLTFEGRFDRRAQGDWVFRLGDMGRGNAAELERFLDGQIVCGPEIGGMLDHPPPGMDFRTGNAIFSGWVTSPHGIAAVDLWFNNRTRRHRAELIDHPPLDICDELGAGGKTRFVAIFNDRPPGFWEWNDVQVEVTDGRGVRHSFDDQWFRWRKRPFWAR